MVEWVLATVLTNCEDDPYYRVKVKCPRVWKESKLMPSLQGIYLDVGDTVMVDVRDGFDNAFIIKKLRYKEQCDLSNVDDDHSPILFEASDREGNTAWMYLRTSQGGNKLHFKNWKGVEVTVEGENVDIIVPGNVTEEIGKNVTQHVGGNVERKIDGKVDETVGSTISITAGGNVTVKAPKVTVDAQTVIPRTTVPGQPGPFCALHQCLLTGAPHTNNTTLP